MGQMSTKGLRGQPEKARVGVEPERPAHQLRYIILELRQRQRGVIVAGVSDAHRLDADGRAIQVGAEDANRLRPVGAGEDGILPGYGKVRLSHVAILWQPLTASMR